MERRQWMECSQPTVMLLYLLGLEGRRGVRVQDMNAFPSCRVSDRKLRLFACVCYQHLEAVLPEQGYVNPLTVAFRPWAKWKSLSENAVAVAERFVDGLASAEEIRIAASQITRASNALEPRWRASTGQERKSLHPKEAALALAMQITDPRAPKAAYYASSNTFLEYALLANPDVAYRDPKIYQSQRAEERAQTDVLRCIFGNLFCSEEASQITSFANANVCQLARHIYDTQDFDALPILADALEEAGCSAQDAIVHCREEHTHAKGCWVLDLVLGQS